MGEWVHRISGVDPEARMGTCAACGRVRVKPRSNGGWQCKPAWRKHETKRRKSRPATPEEKAKKAERNRKRYLPRQQKLTLAIKPQRNPGPYQRFKADRCERCGFVAEVKDQLDVHHLDGNHHNNEPDNLRTLCANCHRLEHARQRRGH